MKKSVKSNLSYLYMCICTCIYIFFFLSKTVLCPNYELSIQFYLGNIFQTNYPDLEQKIMLYQVEMHNTYNQNSIVSILYSARAKHSSFIIGSGINNSGFSKSDAH